MPSTTITTVASAPPTLEITDPQPDAVVNAAVYAFHGVTDPGCIVDVGDKYFAEVDPDGNWTLSLVLRPGGNTTTLTATDPDTGLRTTQRLQIRYEPVAVLSSDGLGAVTFDDPVDEAIATLTKLFGPPSSDWVTQSPFGVAEGDSGPAACNTLTGYPCFDYIRFLIWDDVGMSVVIGDWVVTRTGDDYYDRERAQAAPNLRGYSYWGGDSGPVLFTAEGITIGSTVEDLAAAFGEDLGFDCGEILEFSVTIDAEGRKGVRGHLSGVYLDASLVTIEAIDRDTEVLSIGAGAASSC
jgi:hypothetical protein